MREKMMKAASLLLAASLLTGCSLTNTASGTLDASGGAVVSGSVASLSVVSAASEEEPEKAEVTKITRQAGSKYANDDNEYATARWGDALFQRKLDTASDGYDQTIYMDISSLQWVTNEWIYYTVYGDEEEELWRMPIEKTKKENKVKKDKKEKLFGKYELSIVYATDSYLVTKSSDKKDNKTLCRYDLGTRKLTELIGYKELGEICFAMDDSSRSPFVMNGDLIIEGEKKLFRVNPETGESAVLYSRMPVTDYGRSGNILYFLMENVLYQYDSISRKVIPLIQKETFKEAVNQQSHEKIQNISVEDIYVEKGRVYFDISTERVKQEPEEFYGGEQHYYKMELFSAPEDNLAQLCREDALMDYLDKRGIYEKEFDEEDLEEGESCDYHHTESLLLIRDGIIYARYETKNGEDHYVKYDTQTQKIEKISWEEFVEIDRLSH